jgi:hypothetical protein
VDGAGPDGDRDLDRTGDPELKLESDLDLSRGLAVAVEYGRATTDVASYRWGRGSSAAVCSSRLRITSLFAVYCSGKPLSRSSKPYDLLLDCIKPLCSRSYNGRGGGGGGGGGGPKPLYSRP